MTDDILPSKASTTEQHVARLLDFAISAYYAEEARYRNQTLGEWLALWVPMMLGLPVTNYLLSEFGLPTVSVSRDEMFKAISHGRAKMKARGLMNKAEPDDVPT